MGTFEWNMIVSIAASWTTAVLIGTLLLELKKHLRIKKNNAHERLRERAIYFIVFLECVGIKTAEEFDHPEIDTWAEALIKSKGKR